MTIRKIIEAVDLAKPNDLETALKVQWIAELDGKIAADVFLMGYSELAQFRYTHPEDLEKEPLVSFPHDDIYRLWLMAKIDLANGEYNKYQNTMMAYNESYGVFARWFARVWRPAQGEGGCFTIRDDVPQYYITAYGLAVRAGFTGSLEEWFASLRGDPGKSAYEQAKEAGYEGTKEEFSVAVARINETMAYAAAAQEAAEKAEKAAANFEVDATLTAEGKAADAKATGARLGVLETEVRPIERGGTGADTAEGALAALGAMKSTLVNEEFKIFVFEGPNLDETLQSIFTNMIGGTNKVIKAVRENAFIDHEDLVSERFSLEGGSVWMILLTKASSKFGSVIAWQYGEKRPVIKIKAVYNDRWSEWETITPDITEGSWVNLWENETYTSAFDPRIVEIAEGKKYKTLYIIFRHSTVYGHTSYAQLISGTGVKHYPAATLTGTSGASTKLDETYRYFNRSDMTHVSFQPGYRGSTVDNTACVPFAIYGVKY